METPSLIDKVIEHLNSKEGCPLSLIKVGDIPLQYLEEIVQMDSVYCEYDSHFKTIRGVYKTKSGFYIYVDRIINLYFDCDVYFKPEQLNEVKFFVNRLKRKTNGNTNS